VVGLDGKTGTVLFRWPVPRSSRSCDKSNGLAAAPPILSEISVPDGIRAAASVVTVDRVDPQSPCGTAGDQLVSTLRLVRLAPTGEVTDTVLHSSTAVGPNGEAAFLPRMIVPHYYTTVLVPWMRVQDNGQVENHITRVERTRMSDYTLPFMGDVGIGDDMAYTITIDKRTLVAFDPVTGAVHYIRHAPTGTISVLMVSADRKLLIQHTGPLVDENGKPVSLGAARTP
jgi:hypothetical protein